MFWTFGVRVALIHRVSEFADNMLMQMLQYFMLNPIECSQWKIGISRRLIGLIGVETLTNERSAHTRHFCDVLPLLQPELPSVKVKGMVGIEINHLLRGFTSGEDVEIPSF